jgi:glycosyltransferase involved in cell wall biosynthesis
MVGRRGSLMSSGVSILVSSNLGANLTRGKLLPLVQLPEVREIVVVQDMPGPPIAKVRYVTLGAPRLGKVPQAFLRVLVLCLQIVRTWPDVVMGIYMMPHGLLAYVLGRLVRRHVCIYVIGGRGEIVDGGYWMDQWQVRRPSKRVERLYLNMLRRTDIVVVIGTGTKRYLEGHGVHAHRIHVISAKVDAQRFRPAPATRPDYDLIIAAQLIALKRIDLFLRVVDDLRRRYAGVRAAILGDGPLRDDLERLACSLGIADRVEFLGFHEDAERYYTRAKVFVLTSSTEGLSLAMMEAMACGLPVVVPAIGDLADVVSNGVTGYLVDANDREAFVMRVGDLLDDDERRRRIGENARALILRGYTIGDGARVWHAVLDRIQSLATWSPVPHDPETRH